MPVLRPSSIILNPLLPAGHFGLGHGGGAHAPDEHSVIESRNPKVQGINGATRSHVEFLYELGGQS